jgi:predicted anti-sigma-YlaC factor YlaD
MSDCPLAHSDAAYVLGSLSPAERLEFERHLPGCAACRSSVAQLAGLPGLLGRVGIETVESTVPPEPVPDTVLPALVATVRREQRRKTVVMSLGAAAAVAAVAIGAAALQSARDDGRASEAAPSSASPSIARYVAMDVVVDWGMRAEVSLTPMPGGTSLLVNCTYAESDQSGHEYHYRLVVFTRDGTSKEAMDWTAGPGEDRWGMPGTTGIRLEDMKRVEVQNDRGDTILRLKL